MKHLAGGSVGTAVRSTLVRKITHSKKTHEHRLKDAALSYLMSESVRHKNSRHLTGYRISLGAGDHQLGLWRL